MRKHYAEAIMNTGFVPTPLGGTLAALMRFHETPVAELATSTTARIDAYHAADALAVPLPPIPSVGSPVAFEKWRWNVIGAVRPAASARLTAIAKAPDLVTALNEADLDIVRLPFMVETGCVTHQATNTLLRQLERKTGAAVRNAPMAFQNAWKFPLASLTLFGGLAVYAMQHQESCGTVLMNLAFTVGCTWVAAWCGAIHDCVRASAFFSSRRWTHERLAFWRTVEKPLITHGATWDSVWPYLHAYRSARAERRYLVREAHAGRRALGTRGS